MNKPSVCNLKCRACEGDADRIDQSAIKQKLAHFPNWKLIDNNHIVRTLKVKNFEEVKTFFDAIYPIIQE